MHRFVAVVTIIISNGVFNAFADNNIGDEAIDNFKTYLKTGLQYTFADLADFNEGHGNEDIHLNTTQLIAKYKYPVEEYTVQTSDGYLLKLVRIPNYGKPVVFLMHGILFSADDFITPGPEIGLPYLLYIDGYDVWLGNVRGNKYSRNHITLSPDSFEFWDFSFNEFGLYDLPAMVDFILSKTRQSSLVYIGFSQCTTAFFVMCSELRCDDKISLMIAMAPIAWVAHIKSPILKFLSPFASEIDVLLKLIGINEFASSDPFMFLNANIFCANLGLARVLCNTVLFTLTGFDYEQTDIINLSVIYGHLPAGTSNKNLVHYAQNINANTFKKYDYGSSNKKIYGTLEPPAYNVRNITVPVALYHADNDWLAVYEDIEHLINLLPNVVQVFRVPLKTFNHVDFLWAKDVKKLVYKDIFVQIQKYTCFV